MKLLLIAATILMILSGCTAKDFNANMSKIGDGAKEIVDTGKDAVNSEGK